MLNSLGWPLAAILGVLLARSWLLLRRTRRDGEEQAQRLRADAGRLFMEAKAATDNAATYKLKWESQLGIIEEVCAEKRGWYDEYRRMGQGATAAQEMLFEELVRMHAIARKHARNAGAAEPSLNPKIHAALAAYASDVQGTPPWPTEDPRGPKPVETTTDGPDVRPG